MKTQSAPSSALVKRIQKWKKDQGIISLTLDELKDKIKGKDAIIEQKVDGQSELVNYRAGEEPQFASLGGVLMWDLPVLDEIKGILAGRKIRSAQMVGELAGYENGKIIPFNETMSLIKNPKADKTKVHWFPYQTLERDGEEYGEGFETYMKMWPELKAMFKGSTYVHPVKDYQGSGKIDEAWKTLVEDEDNEGIVVRTSDNKVYKAKPEFSYDLVIIAVGDKKLLNWPKGLIGTTLMAFMDSNNVFRTAGEVGTGWTQEERRELFQWAQKNKVDEDNRYVWVKPQKIMEIKWERTTIKEMPAYRYSKGTYESAGKLMSGTIVKPRFVRWRDDKKVTPSDLRLTQIPDWKEKEKMAHRVASLFCKALIGFEGEAQ